LEDAIAEEILKGDIEVGDTLQADHEEKAEELTLKVKKKVADKEAKS
jgi:ATP-dependent Clp protease ATP-binding subunit ClpC